MLGVVILYGLGRCSGIALLILARVVWAIVMTLRGLRRPRNFASPADHFTSFLDGFFERWEACQRRLPFDS